MSANTLMFSNQHCEDRTGYLTFAFHGVGSSMMALREIDGWVVQHDHGRGEVAVVTVTVTCST